MTPHRIPLVKTLSAVVAGMASATLAIGPADLAAADYSWQDPKATVVPSGDLQWAPQPFEFVAGDTVRYIDYENGEDGNPGTKAAPWKHHPWDGRATGNAADASGPITYVFKRGVTYRIDVTDQLATLVADESGQSDNPIRLTSDPSWGEGEAVIAGSQPLPGTWKKVGKDDAPARMDVENHAVWVMDFAPDFAKKRHGKHRYAPNETVLFYADESGQRHNLYLASDVGWPLTHHSFALHHWNTWDNYTKMGQSQPRQDDELKGKPADYFEGGTLWSQYAWVIANPQPETIKRGDYDPQKGTLGKNDGNRPVNPGTRYLIEDLPQFLDEPGEYWHDRQAGKLYLIAPEGGDPNDLQVEYSTALNSIEIQDRSHIDISGLTFTGNGREDGPFWINYETSVINAWGDLEGLTIRNCRFHHLANDAVNININAGNVGDDLVVRDCDFAWVNGGTGINLVGDAGSKDSKPQGVIHNAAILRNRAQNMGLYRHNDHMWSNVPTFVMEWVRVGEVAGNIVDTAWGSGIVVQGGSGGKGAVGRDIPLTRLLVHHNKTEHNALAVNDYGGFSLWQHGPIYNFNNIAGNSVGHWPGGFFNSGDRNLSYPVYLDGGFKIYNFNNIVWAVPSDKSDPYSSSGPAFFNVFGYMNPFVNNTVTGTGDGIGGTSGNRNEYISNVFADIHGSFIHANHGGNPSLIGGDDTGQSGIDGANTLAYAANVWAGKGHGGTVASKKRGALKDLESDDLETLFGQMQAYPLRFAEGGQVLGDQQVLASTFPGNDAKRGASEMDFRPQSGSAAVDAGATFFVPWSLAKTVGEWHFNENRATPDTVLDYHYYPSEAYFNRKMYTNVPVYELTVNNASIDDYVPGVSEDWCRGALQFDGKRLARLAHAKMTADIVLNINEYRGKKNFGPPVVGWDVPKPIKPGKGKKDPGTWADDAVMTYPGAKRKNPNISDTSALVEATLRIESGHTGGGILGKYDGQSGYRLFVNDRGGITFAVASGGKGASVSTSSALNDGEWHHVLAELDRDAGQLTIYVDGEEVASESAAVGSASLANTADFLVGTTHDEQGFLVGAIDFMRVCRASLAESQTTIDELYAWQTDGPAHHDFAGRDPQGKRRDAGALEH